MEIRDYKIGDEHQILELFEIVFKQKLSLENWLWRFRDNPAGKHLIKLMWEGDKLIGHYAVSPVYMNVDDQKVLTAHSLTTMTHPAYGGKGIFKQLSLALYEDIENNLNCKAVWGFPNNNSHYGFIKRLNWSNLAVIHTLGLDPKKIQKKDIKFKVKEIDRFVESHVNFINKQIIKFGKIFVLKDLFYLNWRFINKPNANYKCYEFQSASSKAIVIVKFYQTKNQKHDLNIIDCYMDDYEEIQNYIGFIINNSKLKIEKVTLWKSLFDPNHLSLEKQGFAPTLPQSYISARIHHSAPNSFSDFRNWNFSMSDSDVF